MSLLLPSGMRPDTSIELRTRTNTKIDNNQTWQLSRFEWSQLADSLDRFYEPYAVMAGEPCPIYNCHGLTFGSRRTGVHPTNQSVFSLLDDDGFKEVSPKLTRPGDVILYFDSGGELIHSGIVIAILEYGIPRVWSKWGKGYEMVHVLAACPYKFDSTKFYRLQWK